MKKIIVLFVMVMLVVSGSVMAADLEFNGGVTYNSFDGEYDGDGSNGDYDIDNGIGFFIEGLYPLNENVKIGGGYDYAVGDIDSDDDSELNLAGPYAKLVYSFQNNFHISAGLAYYKAEVDPDEGSSEDLAEGLGYLLGVSYTYPIKEDMNLVFGGDYRLAKLEVDEDYNDDDDAEVDLSGFRLSAALNYSF